VGESATRAIAILEVLFPLVMVKRTVMDFSDLRHFPIECAACNTRIALDVERLLENEVKTPNSCPACGNDFGTMNHIIGKFVRAYGEAKDNKNKLRFEIDEKSSTQN
jgi:hypothetical protein